MCSLCQVLRCSWVRGLMQMINALAQLHHGQLAWVQYHPCIQQHVKENQPPSTRCDVDRMTFALVHAPREVDVSAAARVRVHVLPSDMAPGGSQLSGATGSSPPAAAGVGRDINGNVGSDPWSDGTLGGHV
jgi:hypothetical protein